MQTRRQSGFTLIELMITVAIVAILASIALPSYADYVKRGRITDALNQLSTLALRLEQNFQNANTYVTSYCTSAGADDTTTSKYFTLNCKAPTSATFTITATGTGSMVGYTYTINESSSKTTTAFPGVSGSKSCWMTKKGDC